jgi:hypothetical protein
MLVVVAVPFATATLQGCLGGNENEPQTVCFEWPDKTRSDIDPNQCPTEQEAEERYLPADVLGDGNLRDDGLCCYEMMEFEEPLGSGCDPVPFSKPQRNSNESR